MRREKEILQIDVELTDEEKLSMSRLCLADMVRIGELEDSLRSFKTQKLGEINGLREHFNLTSNKVLRGREFRAVLCRIVYDFERKMKFWIREDNHDIVKDDIIMESELQEELSLKGADKKTRDFLWREDMSTFCDKDHETVIMAWSRLFPDQTLDQLVVFAATILAGEKLSGDGDELEMPNGTTVGQDSEGWYILKPKGKPTDACNRVVGEDK